MNKNDLMLGFMTTNNSLNNEQYSSKIFKKKNFLQKSTSLFERNLGKILLTSFVFFILNLTVGSILRAYHII